MTTKPYFDLLDVLIANRIQKVVVLQIKNFVSTAKKEQLNNARMTAAKLQCKNVTYLSWAEKVNTLPLTSSNSTKPGYFSDSVSNKGNPPSSWPLLMYLKSNCNERKDKLVETNIENRNRTRNTADLKLATKLTTSKDSDKQAINDTSISCYELVTTPLMTFFNRHRREQKII